MTLSETSASAEVLFFMGLAILTIVWYSKYVYDAYTIHPPNLFCMLTQERRSHDRLFLCTRVGLVIQRIVWYDRYTLKVHLKRRTA